MKVRIQASLLVVAVAATLLISCGSDNNDRSDIISRPPYAPVTDSIRQFPDNPRYYLARAILLSQNNLHSVATPDYKKAWELSNEEGVALEYASNLQLINKPDDALSFLKQCRDKFPENFEFSRRISELYALLNQKKEAIAEYDKILAIDSLNFMAWYEKGLLLTKLKDTNAAIEALERSFSIQPLAYSGLALADIYGARHDPRVLEICDAILIRDSTGEMIDAIMLKGIYHSDKEEYATALKYFEECIKRDWKFTQAHIEKGIVFFRQQKYNEALEVFNKAVEVSNTNPDGYFWLGRTYEAMKDLKLAKENYERSLSLDPTIDEARDALKRIN